MIKAKFYGTDEKLVGFRIEGHSGYSEVGSDIICASVSAGTMLVINTLEEFFGAEVKLNTDEKAALIDFEVISCPEEYSFAAEGLIASFRNELCELQKDYPKNIKVE